MAKEEQGDTAASRWTPEQIMQALKEIVTAALGLLLVGYTLITAGNILAFVGDEARMSDAKDVLLLLLGLAGVVIGYYFGRVPADARTTQAQQQANEATAQAEQVSSQAEAVADQIEMVLAGLPAPADAAARSGYGAAGADSITRELQQLRDRLRRAASDGRRR